MKKRLILSVLLVVVMTASLMLALTGCGSSSSSTSNATIQKKAEEQVSAAKAALEDAEAKGVSVQEEDEKLVATAESKMDSDPVAALTDATVALSRIEDDVKDAFNVAEQTYATAYGAAQTVMKGAPEGTDLAQANQSAANAEARKAAAKTIPDWYNPSDGPIYWANLAAQQAAEASNARAIALGQQQGAAQEQKAMGGSINQMIDAVNKDLQSKNYDPSTFMVGIVKSNGDASVITAEAVPKTPMPGQPAYFTYVFQYKNGAYVLTSAQ